MPTITETAVAFASLGPTERVVIRFGLVDQDAVFDTLNKRLRAAVQVTVERSDGRPPRNETIIYSVMDSSPAVGPPAPAQFTAGDAATLRGLLQKLYNSATADAGG